MLGYLKEKKLVYIEDIDEGLESAVGAFVKLLSGGNVGKQILKVATDWHGYLLETQYKEIPNAIKWDSCMSVFI